MQTQATNRDLDGPVIPPPVPVVGGRVLLRPYALGDIDAVHDYYSRPGVSRYLLTPPMSRDAVTALVTARAQRVSPERSGEALALVVEHGGHVVGDVVLILNGLPVVDRGEIGWVLHPTFAGRGLATEAADLLLRLAFDHYELGSVTARLDGRNRASARLCSRLGMELVGVERRNGASRGQIEVHSYVVTLEQWRRSAVGSDEVSACTRRPDVSSA